MMAKTFLVTHPNRDGHAFTGMMAEDDCRLEAKWGYTNHGEVQKAGKAFRQPNGHMATPFVHLATGRVYVRFVDWSARETTMSGAA